VDDAPRELMTDQCDNQGVNYHFLRRALCEEISVAQVVDLDVLDVVAVRDVHLPVDRAGAGAGRGLVVGGCARPHRGDIDMLDTLAGLELRVDPGSGGSWGQKSASGARPAAQRDAGSGAKTANSPAAAAGSTGGDLESVGSSRGFERGLRSRSRPESGLRAGGERERRSKRERRGSGSV